MPCHIGEHKEDLNNGKKFNSIFSFLSPLCSTTTSSWPDFRLREPDPWEYRHGWPHWRSSGTACAYAESVETPRHSSNAQPKPSAPFLSQHSACPCQQEMLKMLNVDRCIRTPVRLCIRMYIFNFHAPTEISALSSLFPYHVCMWLVKASICKPPVCKIQKPIYKIPPGMNHPLKDKDATCSCCSHFILLSSKCPNTGFRKQRCFLYGI